MILETSKIINDIDEEANYLNHVYGVARIFEDFFDDTYFSVEEKDNDMIIRLVTTNLAKRFEEMIEKKKQRTLLVRPLTLDKVFENFIHSLLFFFVGRS